MRFRPVVPLAAVLLLLLGGAPAPAAGRSAVDYVDGKLSVDFDDVPLMEAFQEISSKAGVVFRAPASVREKRVSVSFRDFPLERGVREVLRNLSLASHAVIYDPATGVSTFVIVESGGPSRAPAIEPVQARAAAVRAPISAAVQKARAAADDDEDDDDKDDDDDE